MPTRSYNTKASSIPRSLRNRIYPLVHVVLLLHLSPPFTSYIIGLSKAVVLEEMKWVELRPAFPNSVLKPVNGITALLSA